jgi:hypothetical protein
VGIYLPKDLYLKNTYNETYKWVKTVYIPHLQKVSRGRPTVFDLGHHNLYLYKPLVEYLHKETNFSFAFVRIHRDRLEQAVSLKFLSPGEALKDLCNDKNKERDVILKVPQQLWNGFSTFQHALWMIDEVEARWRELLEMYPNLPHIEVIWGKSWPKSVNIAASEVARRILFSNDGIDDHAADTNHVKHYGDQEIDYTSYAMDDLVYKKAMHRY